MTQQERDWIYDMAYQFQAMKRRKWKGERKVVVIDGDDLDKVAERMREIAEKDGEKLVRGRLA